MFNSYMLVIRHMIYVPFNSCEKLFWLTENKDWMKVCDQENLENFSRQNFF